MAEAVAEAAAEAVAEAVASRGSEDSRRLWLVVAGVEIVFGVACTVRALAAVHARGGALRGEVRAATPTRARGRWAELRSKDWSRRNSTVGEN